MPSVGFAPTIPASERAKTVHALSQVSIVRSCRPRQCSLLCLTKSIPCCRARQNELGACRAKSERFFVPRQRDFSVLCSFIWDGLVSEEQGPSTATRGCRSSMLDTNTVNKQRISPARRAERGSRAPSIPSFRPHGYCDRLLPCLYLVIIHVHSLSLNVT
jgi:hypothetical protein